VKRHLLDAGDLDRDDATLVLDTAGQIDETVVELGERLGYVRLSARALAHSAEPGLLATLPPQVPVAIGGAPAAVAPPDGDGPAAPDPDAADPDAQATRVSALRLAVDAMLRHPQAADR